MYLEIYLQEGLVTGFEAEEFGGRMRRKLPRIMKRGLTVANGDLPAVLSNIIVIGYYI
jgi:hypothetical protein